jgi:S-layer protein
LEYDAEVVAPTNNVQKVSLNGTKEGTSETNIFTADGVETIALTAKSASDIQIGGDAVTKITVDGSAAFTVTDRAIATLKTIDASAATGAASINAIGNAVTLVKGGAGNDIIYVDREMSKDVVVDGGDGTDTLFITNTNITSTTLSGVTNIEAIGLASDANTTVDVAAAKGLNAIIATLTNDGTNKTGTLDVTNLSTGSTVTLSSLGLSALNEDNPASFDLLGQSAVTLSVKGASKVDTADTLNIVINHNNESKIKNTALGATEAAKNLYVIDEITVADVETITINSQGTFAGELAP